MEKEFDQYEFENYLTDEFFNGNEESEIGNLINKRIASDNDFKKQFELWLEESEYKSWEEFYQVLLDAEFMALDGMGLNDEE